MKDRILDLLIKTEIALKELEQLENEIKDYKEKYIKKESKENE